MSKPLNQNMCSDNQTRFYFKFYSTKHYCYDGECDKFEWKVTESNQYYSTIIDQGKMKISRQMELSESICLNQGKCYNVVVYSPAISGGFEFFEEDMMIIKQPHANFIENGFKTCVSSQSKSATRTSEPNVMNVIPFFLPVIILGILLLCIALKYLNRVQIEQGEDERKETRRLKILANIIHKKVLPKKSNHDDNHNDGASVDSGGKDISLILPHEIVLSNGAIFNCTSYSGVIDAFKSSQNDQGSETDMYFFDCMGVDITSQRTKNSFQIKDTNSINISNNIGASPIFPIPIPVPLSQEMIDSHKQNTSSRKGDNQKEDIYEQSMRSFKSEISSTTYSPKICPICLEHYKDGDEIAWSKNENCHHAFHLGCALRWLMDHDECPMYRQDYLYESSNV